ncbi:MAG: alpha/beta fold hydrolase, partial [Chloroflexota bacterium]
MNKLHVEQQGSGPKVLFVHGGEEAGGLTAFAAQTPLAQSFTLIMPDLPGHGQTPANGPVDADEDADLVAELLTEPMHLVGHSYGGSVAMRAAVKRPEMIRSLIVVEPSTIDIAADDPVVLQMLMEMVQAIQIPDLRERVIAFATVLGIHKDWPDPLTEPYRLLAESLPTLGRPSASGLTTRDLTEKIVAA